jgi:hypothetical protein
MKLDELEKSIPLSFLPRRLASKFYQQLTMSLEGLKLIKWPIKAVVLGGGYKHGELTYNNENIGSDIDLYVFSNFIPLFWRRLGRIQATINKPEHFFHYRGSIPYLLPKSRTFWAYKLKHEGIVLKGDHNILQKIKAREDNIPRIEAVRILFQTLVVWLILAELDAKTASKPFTILRAYLNIGESYLTFFGYLKPSYSERLSEFKNRANEFGLEEELKEKVILGYLTKVDPNQAHKKIDRFKLTISQAKFDCLKIIGRLLAMYLKGNLQLGEEIEQVEREMPVKRLFNLFSYIRMRKVKGVKPKFFSILFEFKITDLWKIAVYHEVDDLEKRDAVLKKFFVVDDFSDQTLVRLFELQPSFSIVEVT